MLHAKKKISKRELKQDALITSYMKATSFYEENKKNIQIGIIALVVLIVGSVVYINNRNANNEKAATDLGRVYHYFDSGQYQLAIDGIPEQNVPGLKAIVDENGGTHAGNLARFYLAEAYYKVGKYDESIAEMEDFSADNELLTVARLAGMAGCYEAKGEWSEAGDYYEKAATRYAKETNAAEYLNSAARNFALAGKKDRALDLYKKLKKNYPTSTYARDADRYIAELSV